MIIDSSSSPTAEKLNLTDNSPPLDTPPLTLLPRY